MRAQAGRRACKSRRRCSFAATVFHPAHAVGDERDGAGVDGAKRLFETLGKSFAAVAEMGGVVLEVLEDFPAELLHHVAVADFVSMGDGVFGGRRDTSDGGKLSVVMGQPVTDVVETDGMGELGVEQGHDVTPRAEGARLADCLFFIKVDPEWDQPPANLIILPWDGCDRDLWVRWWVGRMTVARAGIGRAHSFLYSNVR